MCRIAAHWRLIGLTLSSPATRYKGNHAENLHQTAVFLRYVFGYSNLIVLSSRYRVSCMLKARVYSLLV
ncbi:hypothetical protein KCP78_10245 [Salmonella enterica subsp. enterica]|nr:hypothetical protein KCP78_10245 [Salmonella enterica subsp. enterica]